MAKNIVIAEGGTAKSFTAKKIQTKAQDSGTVNWIPEDEAVDYIRLVDRKFTANGTYKPEDYNADGFGTVEVDMPANVKEKAITANGEFYAADDGVLGYSKVTVAVPGGGGGGPYTVRFFDDEGNIIKTDATVPWGGSVSCTLLDGTVVNGQYFKGWNPSPTNVKENMNCYPVRGEYIIDGGEIADSWETICAVKGAGYPLGSYKALFFDVPAHTFTVTRTAPNETEYTWSVNVPLQQVAMHMVKVAEGEDNTASSWISTGGILSGVNVLTYLAQSETNTKMSFDWNNSALREWFNNVFLGHFPTCLQNTIKQVTKSHKGSTSYNAKNITLAEKTSLDKIWALSARELYNLFSSNNYTVITGSDNMSFINYVELNGIDYSLVYVPTYGSHYVLRSALYYYWGWTFDPRGTYISRVGTGEKRIYKAEDNNNQSVPFGFCL